MASGNDRAAGRIPQVMSMVVGQPLSRRWELMAIAGAALVVNLLAARAITHPGYMDAYYYFGDAKQLAHGQGFSELYLWNYLGAGLPGMDTTPPWPSHLYWMPLTSMVAAPFMAAAERLSGGPLENGALFRAAQWPFMLLASALPLLSYVVAVRLGGRPRHARTAAALTALAPFYLVFWPNTDAFAAHGLAAAGALLLAEMAAGASTRGQALALASGVCAGLAHLARADGVLVLMVAAGWLLWRRRTTGVGLAGLVVVGYLLVMGPWFWRNLQVVGQPLAGGAQTLWLRDYNELFNYPADTLTPAHFLGTGWAAILGQKWAALRDNVITLAVAPGGVIAFPFALLGLWRCRRAPLTQVGAAYGLALLAAMSLGFSLPGARGGYFHSAAALLPWLMAAAPLGLDAAVDAVARRLRHWQPERSQPVFAGLLVVGVLGVSVAVYGLRVFGAAPARTAWRQREAVYGEAAAWMVANGAGEGLMAANNPPAWTYWSGQPAIVIPNGGLETLLRVMDDYATRWVLLDQNYPEGLKGLYAAPESAMGLRLRATLGGEGPAVYLLERAP